MFKAINSNTTERERLLHTILYFMSLSSSKLGENKNAWDVCPTYDKPEIGELVIGNSGEIGHLIKVNISPTSSFEDVYSIQILGTDKIVNWSNESFKPIKGINPLYLLEGKQYDFYQKIKKIFSQNDDISYIHTFNNIIFEGDDAQITVRYRWSQDTYLIDLQNWKNLKTIKSIKSALIDGGWGKEKNEHNRI